MENNNYSLSDLAAVTGGNGFGGMGNGGLLILIVLFLLFGSNGYGRGDYGQFATAASQQDILFSSKFQALDNKIDRIGNGIADATYALNNAITGEGRGIQTQLAASHCENQKNVDALRFDMSNYAASVNATTTAQTQKILDAMAQNKIDSLQAQVNELKTQNMFCGIPRINPYGYGIYAYPTATGCPCANV